MNREEKKRATRKKIMDTALELFAEQGYEATTVHQITERAGVGKGTFFNYFECKEDVLCDIQTFWATTEFVKLKDKSGPILPHLREFLMELVRLVPYTRQLVRAIFQSSLGNEKSLSHHLQMLGEMKIILIPLVEEAQKRGEFSTVFPAEMIADQAIQTYMGVLLSWGMGMGDEKLNNQMAVSFELFFRSLQP
ncbi:TetR/AcrR family transcriptional regulator [Paenibacillus sp. GCM10023248]|uniref:TetR/AcrR family transcriptional regulator n=1 Tax=Bacillales TaxID=1385 RepID=UPI002378CFE5|nr:MULTISPECIES: TetR/AcrR family transcriptional regulator [Bacillales]MDD9272284.1 TetR/AcrR family transcriptional regulator [Paenibacillus sp. MAHUQ-63]MDR6885493.1 AcrR family transcriptional regulator [Bacillus sp. 3255]